MKKIFTPAILANFFLLACLGIIFCGADYLGSKQVERSKNFMGSLMDITLFESSLTRENASRAIDRAFELAAGLEAKVSDADEASFVSRVRKAKPGEIIELDEDTFNILKQAVRVSILTDGAYDVTAGPLKKMWLQSKDEGEPPSEAAIKAALPLVSYKFIELDELGIKLTVKKEGVSLYLSDIVKAYAVDKVADFLKDQGVTSAFISFGENSRFLGVSPDGRSWRIGIEHPRKIDEYAAILEAADPKAFSVSSDYDDFFIYKNRRYTTFCNPKTGSPENNHVSSVTVIADKALLANLVSQAFFVLGPEKGYEMVEQLKEDGVEAICIEETAKDRFTLSGSENAQSFIKEIIL